MNPWKEKVLAYNRQMAARKEKADDLGVLVEALLKLPPGQTQKVFTQEVMAVLAKYGLKEEA